MRPLLVACLLLGASCGAAPTPSAKPAATPAAGPRVVMPSGAAYRLEVARTPEEQSRGLMFRESLPPRTGMLFLFGDQSVHKFWMKNTMIPLDMIWLDPEGKVLFVSADTPPCKADPCPTYGPDTAAATVLEIAGGKAKAERIKMASRLQILDVK